MSETEKLFRPRYIKTEVYDFEKEKWVEVDFRSVQKGQVFRCYKSGVEIAYVKDSMNHWCFKADKSSSSQNGITYSIQSHFYPIYNGTEIPVNQETEI